jgi:hypothetical protein
MSKKIWIPFMLVALILAASVPGYCYTNTVAQKTTDDVSEYDSSTLVGLSPEVEAAIAGGTLVGSGTLAAVGAAAGTYLVFAVPFECLRDGSVAIGGSLIPTIAAASPELYTGLMMTYPGMSLGQAIALTWMAPVVIIVVLVVVAATATAAYIWWSSS